MKLENEYAQVTINASSGQKELVCRGGGGGGAENLLLLIQDQTTSEKSPWKQSAAYWWAGAFFKNDLATAKTYLQ